MKRELLTRVRKEIGNRPVVAQKLNISVIHLRKLENGDVTPSAPMMLRICSFFTKTPEELFPDVMQMSLATKRKNTV